MQIGYMTIYDFELIRNDLVEKFDEFWNSNILKQELLNNNTKYIICKEEDEVLGFAGILINVDDIEIMNIVVRKDKRGQNIGKLLLEYLIKISKELNIKNMTLEVNEKNIPAIKLYEKFNFKTVGLRKKYYNNQDNALIMSLELF